MATSKRRRRRRNNIRKKVSLALSLIFLILILLLGTLSYFGILPTDFFTTSPEEPEESTSTPLDSESSTTAPEASAGGAVSADVVNSADLSIHFLELGNAYTGDCTYIKAGDVDILIDAGSRTNSIPAITTYINQYVTDGTLEFVIVTHAHQDHYAGFATGESKDSLFDLYECEIIIDFALTNQKETAAMYSNYKRELADEIANGATHYTAADCVQNGNSTFTLTDTISLNILDSYYYYNESSDENNYSVCTLLTETLPDGERNYLFTGDLEKEGEEKLVEMNELPEVELFKAGHHGSPTSSNDCLLSVIKPKYIAVCCCCGSSEYTQNTANQFPSQAFIDRIAIYTKNVYITTLCLDYSEKTYTSMNGNIVFLSTGETFAVYCSGSTDPLYKSAWFKEARTCPEAWKDAS